MLRLIGKTIGYTLLGAVAIFLVVSAVFGALWIFAAVGQLVHFSIPTSVKSLLGGLFGVGVLIFGCYSAGKSLWEAKKEHEQQQTIV